MSECPYFDTSHSMADLHYICRAGSGQKVISSGEIKNHPCFTDKYKNCQHYVGEKDVNEE